MNKDQMVEKDDLSIKPQQLADWIKENRDIFILDIRPEEERLEWSIPESEHADIYQKIKSGSPEPFAGIELPNDRPIITICAAGKTSLRAAEQLRRHGIEAWSLEGGMKAWNFVWNTAEVRFDSSPSIIQVRRTAKGCLSYLIGSGDEAVVIDASLEPEVYLRLAEEKGWAIRNVMDTHIHADYVSRTRELAKAGGAGHLLYREADVQFQYTPVDDGQKVAFGDTSITVLHTPGHTPESLSFLIEGKAVFTGDTLFTDGVGRPDLKADRQEAVRKAGHLYDSLQQLLSLDKTAQVLPAHTARSVRFDDPVISSTVGELAGRIELLNLSKDEFVAEVVSRIPPTPSNYLTINNINKKGEHEGYRLEDLETGANRCAVG